MATLFSEDFTGTTGAAWSGTNWVSNGTGTGGSATIQGNAGRIASGTAGGYSGAARVTRSMNITSAADVDISGTFVHDSNEAYPLVVARATTSGVDYNNGYLMDIRKGSTLTIGKVVSYSGTSLGTASKTISAGTTYGFRFQVIGNALKARVWTGSEPGTWDISITDSTFTAAGKTGITIGAGSAAISHAVTFDSIVVTNGASATSLTGTLAFTVTATGGITVLNPPPLATERLFTVGALEIELTPGVWTDFGQSISKRATVKIRQGRPTEFDEVSAAQLTCILDNPDGSLMPDNPGSAYYPNFIEGKAIRFKVTKGGVTYTRFTGWIQAIQPEFPDALTSKASVGIVATDALGLLAQRKLLSPAVEESLARGRSDGHSVDVVEFVGETNGPVAQGTNYSQDVTPGSTNYAYTGDWPTLDFGSADSDITADGMVTASVDSSGDSNSTLLVTQPDTKYVSFMFKTPDKLIVGSTAYVICSLQQLGFTNICHVSIALNGASNALFLMAANGTTNLGIIGDVPAGQWVRVEIYPTGGLASSSTTTATVQAYGGGSGGVSAGAVDMRTTRVINIPGSIGPKSGGKWALLVARGGAGNVVGNAWVTHWTAGSGFNITNRLAWLQAFVSQLPISWASSGTGGTAAAMFGRTAGRTGLDDLQTIMRSGRGIGWARPWDGKIVAAWPGSGIRSATPAITVDLGGDCIGAPSLTRGVDQGPTRVEMTWPGGKTLAISPAREVGGVTRSKTLECFLASAAAAQNIAAQNIADGGSGTRLSRVVIDLVAGVTDHTPTLLSEVGTLGGLFPMQRIQTIVPAAFFGVTTIDHFVYGWEEEWGTETATFTLDTIPATDATEAPPPPDTTIANTLRIGTATYPISGINPGSTGGWGGDSAYPGYRGVDQLEVYSQPTVTVTVTNQYGVEIPADADLIVNSQNDRQASGSGTGTTVPASGIVVSGHGNARTWLLANATVGAQMELIYVAPTGGGGGGGGGGGTGAYPSKVISVYKMMYSSNGPNISTIPASVNEIRLAFMFGNPLAMAGWGAEGQSSALSAMAAKRAAGCRIIISGGGSGNSVAVSNTSTFMSQFATVYNTLQGNVDGFDWDLEASGFTTQQAVNISTALKSTYGTNFAITMVPNGGNVSTYLPAAVACHNAGALDNYGQQFYDAAVSLSAAKGRIQEAINAGLPASKISVGMMIDTDANHWTNAQCVTNMTDIRNTYGIHKAYLWECSRAGTSTWCSDMDSLL